MKVDLRPRMRERPISRIRELMLGRECLTSWIREGVKLRVREELKLRIGRVRLRRLNAEYFQNDPRDRSRRFRRG